MRAERQNKAKIVKQTLQFYDVTGVVTRVQRRACGPQSEMHRRVRTCNRSVYVASSARMVVTHARVRELVTHEAIECAQ